jgi:hypothetical protein
MLRLPSKSVSSERAVVIAVDPHKRSWTAAALDAALAGPVWPDVRREHVDVVAGEHVVGR